MALILKTPQQIAALRAAGQLVRETFELLREHIRPGVTTAELDAIAEEFIRSRGGEPVYKGYQPRGGGRTIPPFPGTICASINEVICHGIPSSKDRLRQGDIIGVDIGLKLNGWVGDACETYPVGTVAPETERLLKVTRECLELAIAEVRPGNTLRTLGATIQKHAEAAGFSVVREYTGHGVGRSLHEEPTVFHYDEPRGNRRLMPGMVFTIEPMINAGRPDTVLDSRDGWTVRTADGSLSAQFEHSLAVTNDGVMVLTG